MKFTQAVKELLGRIDDILAEEEYSDFMLERLYRMKEQLVDPALRGLDDRPKMANAARQLKALHSAVEKYVVFFQQEPHKRASRRKRVQAIKSRVRREILVGKDSESEIEQLLDDIRKWQWKTSLDEQGRLVYSTGSGTVVPGRSAIAKDVGMQVIEQAVKAQRPYSDKLRPRDVRGNPGGLVVIEGAKRLIVVGDLHGRYDNLENILKDKSNLRGILDGSAQLIFTGDAIHPRSSKTNSPEAYEDSFCVMLLIMTLKAENPFNVHYLVGNHDHAHVGGAPAGRGSVRQDALFEKYVVEKFGKRVYRCYKKFVMNCPVTAKLKTPNGYLLLVHAGLTPRVLSEQGLINIFVKGRQGPELQDLLWSRDYDRETLEKCLRNVGASFIIAGHTNPTQSSEERYGIKVMAEGVFAEVHGLQVVLNAQRNVFGYMDIDLTRPLPERVVDLVAPDGKPAFRMLRPKRNAGARDNGNGNGNGQAD